MDRYHLSFPQLVKVAGKVLHHLVTFEMHFARYRSVVDSLVLRQFEASGLVRIEGSTIHVLDHRNDLWSVSSVGDNITTSNSSNHKTIHTGGCESLRTPGITRIGYNDSDDGSLIAGDTIARRIFTEEDLELMVKERFEFWQGRVWNPSVISVSALPHHRRKGYNLFCICPSSPSKKGIQSHNTNQRIRSQEKHAVASKAFNATNRSGPSNRIFPWQSGLYEAFTFIYGRNRL